jgi:hypothetical protein
LRLVACISVLCAAVSHADDFQLTRLEQDILELRRDLQLHQRQLDVLQQQLSQLRSAMPTRIGRPSADTGVVSSGSDIWISPSRWSRVKRGMSEVEVVELLGAPTSMRGNGDGTTIVLFYTLEVGTSGFLSGSVKVANHRVLEVQPPVVKVAP